MSAYKADYEYTLAPVPLLVPTGTATALARVERRAIELNPEALRVIRVGEAENHVVHVVPAHRRVARSERERAAESQHFPVMRPYLIGANGDPVRPLASEKCTG